MLEVFIYYLIVIPLFESLPGALFHFLKHPKRTVVKENESDRWVMAYVQRPYASIIMQYSVLRFGPLFKH